MRIVARLLVLLPLLWVERVWAVDCPQSNYELTTQAEVDALGATGCDSVPGYLYITNTTDITNLDGLASLTNVWGQLVISDNDALTNLDGLTNITSVGHLYIHFNAVLTNLDGLINLTSVEGAMEIFENAVLDNTDGLANLNRVGSYLNVTMNRRLTNLDGLAHLTSVGGSLSISYNEDLTNLNGLANLASVGSEGYGSPNLLVEWNTQLTNCRGIAPVLGWPAGPPNDSVLGEIKIESNATGCNSLAEVLAAGPLQSPTAPAVISTDYEDGKIILTVSVTDNGGTDITGYEATCTDSTNTFTGTSTSSPITVSGLTNDVAYTCTVTATNSVGTSSASAATAPITPEETTTGLPIWLLYQINQ